MNQSKKSRLLIIVLLTIILIVPVFPMAWAMTEFVDDYKNENYVTTKDNMIRNSTLNCMELNYTTANIVLSSPFQLREHDRSAYYPIIVYTLQSTYIDAFSGTTSLGYNWMFFTANRDWLDDKYLQWNWYHAGYSSAYVRVYDGEYNRSSMVDFPNNAGLLLKGNGLLQTLDTLGGTGSKVSDVQFDTSGGSEDIVTVFFFYSDSWTAQWMRMYLYWFKINEESGGSGNIMGWDMSKSGTTLTMEQTGTYNDYGRIDGGDIEDYLIGGYEVEGYFYTTQILNDVTGSSLALLTNATLSSGTIKVQFSEDNSTWVDHNNQTGYDSLIEGFESIDLRDLNFTTIYLRFNFTRGGMELTPRLYQLRLITIPDEIVDDYENEDKIAIKYNLIRNTTLDCMELDYTNGLTDSDIVFQLREHDNYASYNPVYTFIIDSNEYLRTYSTTGSLGDAYNFLVIDSDFLEGKYVRFRWKWSAISGAMKPSYFRVRDGTYDRNNNTQFPNNSGILSIGAGLLYNYREERAKNVLYTIDVYMDLDTWGHTENNVSIMFFTHDNQGTDTAFTYIDWIEINEGAGGTDNLITIDFKDTTNVVMELTGTVGDYGYVNNTGLPIWKVGYFYTDKFLDGVTGSSLALLTNATLSSGTIKVQFSEDNSTWVDHNNQTGYDSLIEGFESIDLRDLNFTTLYMRYNFNRVGIYLTPRLYQIRLLVSVYEEEPPLVDYFPVLLAIVLCLGLSVYFLYVKDR